MKKIILSSLVASALALPMVAKADFINIFDINYTGVVSLDGFQNVEFNGSGVFSFNTPLDQLDASIDSFTNSSVLDFDYEASFWLGDDKDNTFFNIKLSDWLNGTDCSSAATCPTESLSFFDFTLIQDDPTGAGESDAYFHSNNTTSGETESFGLTLDDGFGWGLLELEHAFSSVGQNEQNDDFNIFLMTNDPAVTGGPLFVATEGASYSMSLRDQGTPTDPTDPTTPVSVSEPSLWALMLAGVALVFRRKRVS